MLAIPPLLQLVALFLAVAVLGICSQTTDSYMHVYVHHSLASYTGDTSTRQKYNLRWVCYTVVQRLEGSEYFYSLGKNFKVKKILDQPLNPVFFHLSDRKQDILLVRPNIKCVVRDQVLEVCFEFDIALQTLSQPDPSLKLNCRA